VQATSRVACASGGRASSEVTEVPAALGHRWNVVGGCQSFDTLIPSAVRQEGQGFLFLGPRMETANRRTDSHQHVPTMAERGGDFSDLAACPASAGTGYPVVACTTPRPQRALLVLRAPRTPTPSRRPDWMPSDSCFLTQYPSPTLPLLLLSCPNLNWTASQNVPTPWRERMPAATSI